MKSMKSVLALFIALIILCTPVMVLAAEASEYDVSYTMEGAPSIVETGETFVLPVSIKENKGFLSARAILTYDPAQVTYVGNSLENSDFYSENDPVYVNSAKAGEVVITIANPMIAFSDPNAKVYDQTGLVAELTFTVADDYDGEIVFTLSVNKTDVATPAKDFSYNVAGDKVTIYNNATHKHTYGEGVYEVNETSHWQVCTVCGMATEAAPHIPGDSATEDDDQVCTVCGYVIEEHTGHRCELHLIKVEAKAATCTENGHIEYYVCEEDGRVYKDAAATDETTLEGTVISATGHSFSDEWVSGENGHWHVCSVCNATSEVEAHVPGAEATETNAQSCTVCGYVLAPALGHQCVNHLTKVEAKAATCTEDGNLEYYKCECGKLYKDAAATEEIKLEDTVIAKTGHTPGPEATCTAAQTCTVCGEELAPALGHDYVDGVCTRCGEKDPNYIFRLLGDVDGDGDIDATDYMLLKRASLGTYTLPTDEDKYAADVNQNGEIDSIDYLLVKRHVMGTFVIVQPSAE